MEDTNDQTINENESLLILNDYCIMEIFDRLAFIDFVRVASTCSRLLDVARARSRNYTKIQIDASYKAWAITDSLRLSKEEFSNVLSVIGHHVLEAEIYVTDLFQSVKEKCMNLKSVTVPFFYNVPQVLEGLQNLKELKMSNGAYISINEWKNFFASNLELEVLHYNGVYEEGFMELLTHLPKLKYLGPPLFSSSFRQSPDYHHLLRLTGLTKLKLRSADNLDWILFDLTKSMNLVELDVCMELNNKSLGIIKSFQNLEVLSISEWRCWDCCRNKTMVLNATDFPPRLHRLKMYDIKIPCSKFLEILQHLTLLSEFDNHKYRIFWDGICKHF